MSINATGGFSLTYQWYSNNQNSYAGGNPISGANSSSYIPSTNNPGIEYLWCVVSDNTGSNCDPDTSIIVYSKVYDAIYIAQHPLASQTVCKNGAPATLFANVTANSQNPGPIGLAYNWYISSNNSTNGTLIVGANLSSYTPPTNNIGTFYYYFVAKSKLQGPCFKVTSNIAEVNVIDQPTIISQGPNYQSVCQNTPATPININVSGPNNILFYSWTTSTNPSGPTPTSNLIPGVNGSSFNPPTNNTGTFYYSSKIGVNASGCNTLGSNFFVVDVKDRPMIDGEPSNYANWRQTLCLGAPASILTAYGNSGNFSHQWYHNTINSAVGATPISGANLDNYTPNNYPVGDHYFFCVKSDLSANACPPSTTQIYGLSVIGSAIASFSYNTFGSNAYFQSTSTYATSWYWDFGDGTSSSNHSPIHYYVDGQYTVSLIVNTPCGPDTISQTITINTHIHMPKGGTKGGKKNNVPQNDNSIIKVYPNPVVNQKHFNISVNSTDLGSIKIFDSMANCVKTQTLTSNPSSIDISQLSKGIYAIVWQNNSTSKSEQLIIQ
ncbi:MAG TPA: T9SS type A sorting domain-containing protein [Bacteroidetes bacterium]|nr:T9SS type A sorting domain-containing protein [Bacteroidota bacterium]